MSLVRFNNCFKHFRFSGLLGTTLLKVLGGCWAQVEGSLFERRQIDGLGHLLSERKLLAGFLVEGPDSKLSV